MIAGRVLGRSRKLRTGQFVKIDSYSFTTQQNREKRNSLVNAALEVAGDVRLAAHGGEAQVERPAPLGARVMRRRLVGQLQLHA